MPAWHLEDRGAHLAGSLDCLGDVIHELLGSQHSHDHLEDREPHLLEHCLVGSPHVLLYFALKPGRGKPLKKVCCDWSDDVSPYTLVVSVDTMTRIFLVCDCHRFHHACSSRQVNDP